MAKIRFDRAHEISGHLSALFRITLRHGSLANHEASIDSRGQAGLRKYQIGPPNWHHARSDEAKKGANFSFKCAFTSSSVHVPLYNTAKALVCESR